MTEQEIEDAKLRIGTEIERFQTSEFGMTMIDLAGIRGRESAAKLVNVDPTDPKAIMKLQNEVRCGDRFIEYMAELLEEATSIMSQRLEEEADD